MSKTVSINANPRNKPQPSAKALDAFVQGPEPSAPKEAMKRLTFDIPAALHKRMRLACLQMDVEMTTELRRMISERFPAE